jgi:hypothetical protein
LLVAVVSLQGREPADLDIETHDLDDLGIARGKRLGVLAASLHDELGGGFVS